MKITPKFTFVSGSFDTDEVKMLCLPSDNHGKVDLCIKEKDCALIRTTPVSQFT